MGDDDAELAGLLGGWAAEVAVGDAARARSRQRHLTSQAEEVATLAGTLVDLAESGDPVALHTSSATWTGRVLGVGRDVCVIGTDASPPVVVALASIAAVARAGPRGRWPQGSGDRPGPLDTGMVEVVGLLAADRHRARLQLTGGRVVTGTVRSVGEDVAVVVTDDRSPVVVALASIEAVAPA